MARRIDGKGGNDLITEKERQNREELFRLMRENPDLPVVPMVDTEVVADDAFAWWMGSWGSAQVQEYLILKNEDGIVFKDNFDVFDVLEKYLPDKEFDALPETESECMPFYEALPWIKAITVYIGTP